MIGQQVIRIHQTIIKTIAANMSCFVVFTHKKGYPLRKRTSYPLRNDAWEDSMRFFFEKKTRPPNFADIVHHPHRLAGPFLPRWTLWSAFGKCFLDAQRCGKIPHLHAPRTSNVFKPPRLRRYRGACPRILSPEVGKPPGGGR